jgi:hypothetical protein
MKRLYKLLGIIAIGAVIVVASTLVGCDNGSTSGGGDCPNGSCHVYTDAAGNGSYDVCSQSSCSAYKVPYPIPANTNVKCNCN